MIGLLLIAVWGAALTSAFETAQSCVLRKAEALEKAGEAADVTVDAALTACLKDIADLRVAHHEFIQRSSPSLSPSTAKTVEETSFNLSRDSIRNRAVLRIVEERATNASAR